MVRHHRLSPDLFDTLAEGGGGAVAARHLVAVQQSKNLLLVRALVGRATETRHSHAGAVREAYAALRLIHQTAPEATIRVLTYPPVSAWLARTVALLSHGNNTAASPQGLAMVAAAAAVRGGVRIDLDLPQPDPSPALLVLPSVGAAALSDAPGGKTTLRVREEGAELAWGSRRLRIPDDPHSTATRWIGIPRITTSGQQPVLDVLLDGLSWRYVPMAGDRHRHSADMNADVPAWRRDITQGWEILASHHREAADEVATTITALTPLVSPEAGMTSGTYRDAFGCIAASRPPDPRLAAVTLVHETQHAKLTALMDLFTLVTPGPEIHFYAPWRDDPRPIVGLLHGVYAHVGVASFWREQRHHEVHADDELRAQVEFARWRAAAYEVAQRLLGTDRLTLTGRRFVTGMVRTLGRWHCEPVPDKALDWALKLAARHRARWHAAHGRVA